tara:strand:- start:1187 stop:1381 length:195 start_codon:yes stop_codon:yes gene_type:complete
LSRRTRLKRLLEETKENFMYRLFLENCEERLTYKDQPYTFVQYIESNKEFIEDKWSEYQNETSP